MSGQPSYKRRIHSHSSPSVGNHTHLTPLMSTVTDSDITSIVLEMVDKVLAESADPPTSADNSNAEDERTGKYFESDLENTHI